MTVFKTIRRRYQSPAMLMMVAMTWFAVLTAPCVMAMTLESPATEVSAHSHGHDDCHDANAVSSVAECCCELSDLIKSETTGSSHLDIAPQPLGNEFELSGQLSAAHADSQRIPLHATSPPIYLTTQRLRI